ncbi:MAG: hypothetical protein JST82_01360 [Bacteroidetes bacterium]|nr:hypothetical protein [Bacteroidota bacterium]
MFKPILLLLCVFLSIESYVLTGCIQQQPMIYFKLSGFSNFEKSAVYFAQFQKNTKFKKLLFDDVNTHLNMATENDMLLPAGRHPANFDYIINLNNAQCKYYITDIHFVDGADNNTCILYYKINGVAANAICHPHDKKASIVLTHL